MLYQCRAEENQVEIQQLNYLVKPKGHTGKASNLSPKIKKDGAYSLG
jgi:hypothetical protein